ncbi:rab-like protein 2A [Eurytemora carolleeae]|uniref:rab-like protein 2A n=1 Tax=Eurytemora carolleeae TaxID=1294199 RepID=UPI000C795635|nr:rab-like protein 2A [Eurytemora carolleeae]|eukprot:XP_023346035.1 rab-like protein 2A [Eurytemora affinis]
MSKDDVDAEGELVRLDYDQETAKGEKALKVICLGDSAVGKSKLVERFLLDGYAPQQLSTYALTLYRYRSKRSDGDILIDFWDTAGQERFNSMHRSYYHQAHACILVFDATRKVTYKNLSNWYSELRSYRPSIPALVAVNKIDENLEVTEKSFNFAAKETIPIYSPRGGRDAIDKAVEYKKNPTDLEDQILEELDNFHIDKDNSEDNKDDNTSKDKDKEDKI